MTQTFATISRISAALCLALVFLPSVASAYRMTPKTYESMFARADLVVIATPLGTRDSKQILRVNPVQPKLVTDLIKTVETEFTVNRVLKGKLTSKTLRYLHLNTKTKNRVVIFGSVGTFFVDFEIKENQSKSFILFLRKTKDGLYQASWRPMEGSRAIVPIRRDGSL